MSASAQKSESNPSVKLLIIEDERPFAELVVHALKGLIDEAVIVDRWEDAFRRIEEMPREIVWADLRMPTSHEQESIEAIHKVREHNPHVVIVVGSGYITPEARARLDQADVDACFYKDSNFRPRQVAALVVLAIMRGVKRSAATYSAILSRALEWLSERYPEEIATLQAEVTQPA